jgi:AmmeMemoRadiSam system protein B/AmmeMemoRadiSam system protein A
MLAGSALAAAAASPREDGMTKNESNREPIRPPAVAGAFYPGDADELTGQISGFLKAAPSRSLPGSIQAIIVPHAGYIYSGQVAAHAYKQIQGIKYDSVIVIAPSHRYSFRGAAVYPKGSYQIPLGRIPVDSDLAQKLMQESSLITAIPEAHAREHALEVQLPFLKTVLGEFTLLPLLMGSCDYAACESIAEALYRCVENKHVLIVASSDLSHYHPYRTAVTLDQKVIDYVINLDPRGLYQALTTDQCEACGAFVIITAMLCAQRLGASRAVQLSYATSGDVIGGDKSAVVGYLAAALIVPPAASGTRRAVGVDLGLSDQEKQVLRTIAAAAIEAGCTGQKMSSLPPLSETLREKRGAFVTLHKGNALRGCIGYIRAQKPLYQTIQEMAQAAAFQDTRFKPVTRDELKDITIEISVLTPLQKIKRVEDIAVGTHGIYIVKDFHSGLLLPQVASENKWDRETFLRHTCTKAGLPEHAWRETDTEIYIFSADIF